MVASRSKPCFNVTLPLLRNFNLTGFSKMCASKTNWYAYRTNSRAEKKVEERLRLHQVEVYLPLRETVRQWSDRRKKVKIPLIPGLVFVRLEPHRLNDFLELPGISHVVKYLKQPALIREYEIQNLKILLREAVDIEPTTLQEWQLGDPIEVTEGIFRGLRGKILHKKERHYIIVKIESIGYHFQINIPSTSAQKTT